MAGWQEVESQVHWPGRWLILAVGLPFLLFGATGFVLIPPAQPPGLPAWIARLGTAVFGLMGAVGCVAALRSKIWPTHIRHAAAECLPNVPNDPVVRDGLVVHGRLTHELVRDSDRWLFRPDERLWRFDRRFLLGFGVPSLTIFVGMSSWILHTQEKLGSWPICIACASIITFICGGPVFVLAGMMKSTAYRRLCILTIPLNGDVLELDAPPDLDPNRTDLATGLNWIFVGDSKRQQLRIPRGLVKAVQLCPWKYMAGSRNEKTITWAVQGLLVLGETTEAIVHRQPILLTSDYTGAAQLLKDLASALGVPYLFGGDAKGWKAETRRAAARPPLKVGGMMT